MPYEQVSPVILMQDIVNLNRHECMNRCLSSGSHTYTLIHAKKKVHVRRTGEMLKACPLLLFLQ